MKVVEALEEVDTFRIIPRKAHGLGQVLRSNKRVVERDYARVAAKSFPSLRGNGEIIFVDIFAMGIDSSLDVAVGQARFTLLGSIIVP